MKIPDLGHLAMAIKAQAEGQTSRRLTEADAKMLLETWHLCQDLLTHVKRVCIEPRAE